MTRSDRVLIGILIAIFVAHWSTHRAQPVCPDAVEVTVEGTGGSGK